MRDLVLSRINSIAHQQRNFPKTTMRWQNFTFQGKHISDIDADFVEGLSDADLLTFYESLIRQVNKSM